MMKRRTLYIAGLPWIGALCLLASAVCADDWPQWRGSERNGISRETGLLREWPKDGPKVLWSNTDIGAGYSTPAVAGDRLYLISNRGLEDELLLELSVKDGQAGWSTRLGNVGNPKQQPAYPAARSTPTVDGDVIYALGSDGDLASVSKEGQIRWQKNLRAEFGGQPGVWAYAESPLVDGDVLVCTPGGGDATMVALKKQTGEVIWKAAVPGGEQAAYSSVIVIEAGGVKQYVQFIQKGLVGIEAKTGKFLWRYDKTAQGSPANIPTPVAEKGMIYSATGRGGGGLIRIQEKGGGFEVESLYASPKLPTSIGGAVKVGEHLYGTSGQALLCVDFKSGEIKWESRSVAPGSVCFADGHLYVHGENGDLALVEATPDGYREKGRFTPVNQPDRGRGKAWTYPVIANGRLYIRDATMVRCYDVSGGSARTASIAR